MGTDDLFKKKRELRKKRKYETRMPKANSFLIVTEGERTEPLYFNGLKKLIQEKIGGTVDVVKVDAPDIHIRGMGSSTGRLLEITDELVKKATVMYQNVWIVFDKDDFDDFDQAIEAGKQREYKMAWSNQSFEYWLCMHFNYHDAALHRTDWNEKLDEYFKQYSLGDGYYRKNYDDIYQLVDQYDGVNTAIRNAKRRMAEFRDGIDKPSEYDPGTMVHILVQDLKRYLDEK